MGKLDTLVEELMVFITTSAISATSLSKNRSTNSPKLCKCTHLPLIVNSSSKCFLGISRHVQPVIEYSEWDIAQDPRVRESSTSNLFYWCLADKNDDTNNGTGQ